MTLTPPDLKRLPRALALAVLVPFLASCVVLPSEQRALLLQADGAIRVQSIPCRATVADAAAAVAGESAATLDPSAIRILSWNIHKESDAGWERDLARLAGASDLVLLQEVLLQDTLRGAIEAAGLRWVMASSFRLNDDEVGVLTAARAAPAASCTQRAIEPLLGLPKSVVLTWFRFGGDLPALAVVNVHAINFTLSLGAYRAQLEAAGDALAAHRGPIVFGGDLNTWSEARGAVVRELTARLGLTEIVFADDRRSRFLGRAVDHLLVRDLAVVAADAIPVTSSDHNPVAVTLRFMPQNGSRTAN